MYRIDVQDLCLYGYHGVFSEEKTLGQEFKIDLQCQIDLDPFSLEDDPKQIISYVDIINQVKTSFHQQKYNLIEHLSAKILLDLSVFPQIKSAKIRLKKPNAPIKDHFSCLSVELERSYEKKPSDIH